MLNLQVKPNEDGSLQCSVSNPAGASGACSGKWAYRDDGRYCMSFGYTVGTGHGEYDRCAHWFRAGEDYWASPSDSDRAAGVFKYAVSR